MFSLDQFLLDIFG